MAKVNFTAGRVADFACPDDKSQAFLWDSKAPGLALRVTAAGARAFVFQGRLGDGQTVRMTIGVPVGEDGSGTWKIPAAQAEARRLQSLIDAGRDPRRERVAQQARDRAARASEITGRRRLETTGLMAWAAYCADRKAQWGERNYADHLAFADAGGVKRRRAAGNTAPGPLWALLTRPLVEIDADAVQAWVSRETKARPARALLGFRLLRAFINWCAESGEYRGVVRADACRGKKTREKLGKPGVKSDSLQREQLKAWFAAVGNVPNPVAAAFMQCLLLTGARLNEILRLRWEDVDFQWKSMTIRDKVEDERVIPLTPYVAHLLTSLPRHNEWVFSSARAVSTDHKNARRRERYHAARGKSAPAGDLVPASESGRLTEPRASHNKAVAEAGLPHLTFHGLRRSFGTLSEWVECPVGVVAQIQGHKPSAIAEKHYRVRPIDLLRLWHERIEAWLLEQGGIAFKPAAAATPALRIVASA